MEEDGGEEEGGRGGGTAVPLTGWNTGRSTLGKYSPACNAQVLCSRVYTPRGGVSRTGRGRTRAVFTGGGGRGQKVKGIVHYLLKKARLATTLYNCFR